MVLYGVFRIVVSFVVYPSMNRGCLSIQYTAVEGIQQHVCFNCGPGKRRTIDLDGTLGLM